MGKILPVFTFPVLFKNSFRSNFRWHKNWLSPYTNQPNRLMGQLNYKDAIEIKKLLLKLYYHRFIIFVIIIFCCLSSKSQTTVIKDSFNNKNSTVVIPGKEYNKSALHNFFWGKHYRKEWATAVRVNNFYLDTAMGGLTVVKPSGSRQSMGLRLKRKDGREYVLRSIDKDFGNGLPDDFHGTFISNIAKDQASIGYPFAAITITPMIEAAGIYHTNPIIVFVPKQDALGEYNDKYGGQLYLFEERPDGDQQDVASFGNSNNVIGSEKLFEKVFDDNDNSVDQKAFAKARLFDMFIGDWGRHADQWRWASFKEDGKTIYKPIPRDRDQAYTKFDGLVPSIATNLVGATHLESFHGNIKNTHFFNKPGRELDRQFTNQLTEQQWVALAIELQQALTDEVIVNAMHQLPPQLFAINGEKIIKQLQSRRDHLQDFAHEYYKYLARKIEVYGTSDKEFFEINRASSNETVVKVYKIKKDGSVAKQPYFFRTIYKNETKDVHLFGFKDADVFTINGNGQDGVKIKIIGITKSDAVVHNTVGRDRKTKIFKGNSNLYDSIFEKKITFAPIILMNPKILRVFDEDHLQLFTKRGIHVGASVAFHPAPWRKDSLETVHTLAFNYGVTRKIFTVEYVGFAPERFGKWNLVIRARYDVPAADNFFGIGNESIDTGASSYYNVFSKRLFASVGINRAINDNIFDLSLFYQNVKVTTNNNTYIKENTELPVFTGRSYTGAEAGYKYSNVNNEKLPTKGVRFKAGAGYFIDVDNSDQSFFKSVGSVAFYLPLGKVISIASQVGGGYVSKSDISYYHLSKIGGNLNLRGYPRERFYGQTSFHNNNEVRCIFNTHNILFNGKIGVLGFFDEGRVWLPGEDSGTWHVGYGAGLIIVPFNKIVLSGTYEKSKETTQFQLRAGMFF